MKTRVIAGLLPFALSGCARRADASGQPAQSEEVARVASPDWVVDAVLTRTNPHATADFVHRVYVVPHGERLGERDRELFRADHVDSLSLAWVAPRRLELRYAKARVFAFTNFWHSIAVRNFEYTVELRLHPAGADQLPGETQP